MTADVATIETSLLRDVNAALDPLRRKQRNLQAFMASQLERLEMLAGQMDEREHEVEDRVGELSKQRAALDEEWSHLDALVETAQANALEMRQEKQRLESLAREHHDGPQVRELRRLRDEVDQLSQERNVLEGELASAQRKVGQLADVAVELAEARSELDRLRHESTRMDDAQLAEWKQQLSSAYEERDRLTIEVKRLKHQADERTKQHDEECRKFAEERVEWLTELRSLRRTLAHKAPTPEPVHIEPPRHERSERTTEEDRQFDQVLDQFEAVKRDMAKHRPRKN